MTSATLAKTNETSKRRQNKPFASVAPIMALLAVYAICVALVSPAGDFPLNDDWIYTQAVKTFMESGKFVLYGCCCAACPAHVLIGAAVSTLFGFSYEALRLTSIVFGFIATACLYLTLRELKVSKTLALIGSLLYCTNPIFLNIAFSYMTDGPSAALIALYMYAVVRGLNRNSPAAFMVGGLSLTGAVAVRQTNAVFLAASLIVLLMMWARRKHSWSMAIWLIAMPVVAFFAADRMLTVAKTDAAYDWYKHSSGGMLTIIQKKPWFAAGKFDALAGAACCYMGLFLAPLFAFLPGRFRRIAKASLLMLAMTVGAAMAVVVPALTQLICIDKKMMPFSVNLLRIPSLGSLSIIGINFPSLHRPIYLTSVSAVLAVVFVCFTIAAFFKGGVLLFRYMKDMTTSSGAGDARFARVAACIFCLACTALSIGIVGLQVWLANCDRYYLICLAPCIVATAMLLRWLRAKPLVWVQIPMVILIAAYSTAAQQDYMGWNRARWTALRSMEARGIKPDEIDGGAEYFFVHHLTWTNMRPEFRGAYPRCWWRWWPAPGEKYILSFSAIPGYDLYDKQQYWSALSFSKRNVYVLKAKE